MIEMINDPNEFLGKLNSFKLNSADLSSGEDLSLAVMNLISIEEHLYFTGMKTNNRKYFEVLGSVRAMRSKLLKELIKQPEGELWCTSKHLLAASMRLMEVGTKYLSNNKEKEANEKFEQAFDLYSLFWSLNLNLEHPKNKQVEAVMENKHRDGGISNIREIVKKIVDCCKEL
jgi:hypothetical protein